MNIYFLKYLYQLNSFKQNSLCELLFFNKKKNTHIFVRYILLLLSILSCQFLLVCLFDITLRKQHWKKKYEKTHTRFVLTSLLPSSVGIARTIVKSNHFVCEYIYKNNQSNESMSCVIFDWLISTCSGRSAKSVAFAMSCGATYDIDIDIELTTTRER